MKSTAQPTIPGRSIAIVYGFNEGPRLAGRLHQALRQAGHTITTDHTKADVIIAHSGGCFLLNPRPGQHIIMIGLPYWPGRSVFMSICRKVVADVRNHHQRSELTFWLRKTTWNLVYFWNMRANIGMLRGRARGAHWQFTNVTLVRNTHDAICTPNLAELPFATTPTFVELPGHHDECWREPAAIVQLVEAVTPHRR